MKNKYLIWILVMFLLIYIVNATWTFDDTGDVYANSSNWSSSYPASNLHDQDWGTYARFDGGVDNATYYVNYTKPSNATSSSLWQVKYYSDSTHLENKTIDSSCWDYDANQLMFKVLMYEAGAVDNQTWSCYNGTWVALVDTYGYHAYEEAMWWNSSDPNSAPVMNSSRITPINPHINDTLLGYCNATDADGDNVSYEIRWYNNSVLYTSTSLITNPQEDANSITCSGSWQGSHPCSNTYDNNWNTMGYLFGGAGYVYFNYTYPIGQTKLSGTLWEVKDTNNRINLTLPSGCDGSNPIQLRAISGAPVNYTINWWCHNGTGWQILREISCVDVSCSYIYEEQIWWNLTGFTQAVEINVDNLTSLGYNYGDNFTFGCRAYDGANYSSWLNSTPVYINNSAPYVSTLNIQPTNPNTSSDLTCTIAATDPEGLSSRIEYWVYNGSTLVPSLSGNYSSAISGVGYGLVTIDHTLTKANETWNCTARVHDNFGGASSGYNSTTSFVNYSVEVTLDSPSNNTIMNIDGDTFVCNISLDDLILDNATLYIWNSTTVWYSNTQSINSTSIRSVNWSVTGIPDGDYNWTCTGRGAGKSDTASNRTFTVVSWQFGNCTTYNYTTLTMRIYNEETPSELLNASVEVDAIYWLTTPSNNRSFYTSFSGNNTYSLCLSQDNATIYSDMYIRYTTDNGFTHRYYIINGSFNTTIQNISMYNFDNTTGISDLKITTRNKASYNYYTNIVVSLQRRYSSEGVWRTVQMDKSGDYGQIFFNIKEENTDYRMIFKDLDNNVLKTTDTMKFVCTSGVCELTVLLDPYSATSIPHGLVVDWDYNNNTGNLTINWSNIYGTSSTVRMLVRKETWTGTLTICNTTQSGVAGTMVCDLSAYTGTIHLLINGTGSGSVVKVSEWIELVTQKLGNIVTDVEGAFWAFGIALTTTMFGILTSPVGAVIASMFGLIAIYALGIFTPITLTFMIIVSIIGIVIGMKVRT